MSDFSTTWELTRGRFVDSYQGLNEAQLNFRLFPDTLTIGEMALHVFGVEASYAATVLGEDLTEFGEKLKEASYQGVVNDNPFPFSAEEITPQLLEQAERYSRPIVERAIVDPTDAVRNAKAKSVLGPDIDGNGVLARLSYHPGYHQAQVYMIRQSPNFPA